MKISKEHCIDAIDSGEAESISIGSWRWGYTETYAIPYDGKFYKLTVMYHSDDGMQAREMSPEMDLKEIHKVTRTVEVWEEVS